MQICNTLKLIYMIYWKWEERGTSSSVNNEKDNVSLALSKVPAQKYFSKCFLDGRFVPDKLRATSQCWGLWGKVS